MVRLTDESFNSIKELVKTHKKSISNKHITQFSILLHKLIKFSCIFSDNCNHLKVKEKDIDEALLTLGIVNVNTKRNYNKMKKIYMYGGSETANYLGYCDNNMSQCVETQACMEGGGKRTKKNVKRKRFVTKMEKCNRLSKICMFPRKQFSELVNNLNQNKECSFKSSLCYLNYVSKYLLKSLLNELD